MFCYELQFGKLCSRLYEVCLEFRHRGQFFFVVGLQGEPIVRRHYFALLILSRLSKRRVVRRPEAERASRELTPRRRKFAASRLTAGEKAGKDIRDT